MQASGGHRLDPDSKAKDPCERKISATERKIVTSITRPASPERPERLKRPVQQHHQDQQRQDIDERPEQHIDFSSCQRREEQINFQEESYHEYINNFPQEHFQNFKETTTSYDSRYMGSTFEKLPGQLQIKRLYNEFENNWDFFPTPHLVISIEEK